MTIIIKIHESQYIMSAINHRVTIKSIDGRLTFKDSIMGFRVQLFWGWDEMNHG